MTAATSEFIDADPHDYGRSTDKTALIARKLVAAQYHDSPSEMDEPTQGAYKSQLERVEEAAKEGIPGIDGLLTLEGEHQNVVEEVNGQEMIKRKHVVRIDSDEEKWATHMISVYVEDEINGQQINQWLILEAMDIPIGTVQLK